MKLKIYRILSLMIFCSIMCTMTTPIFAQEDYLGTNDDLTGYVIPDGDSENSRVRDDISQESGSELGTDPLIFSITAAQVSNLLTSNAGGKSFTISQLPSSAYKIVCMGTLFHSRGDNEAIPEINYEYIEAGVCYYGYNPRNGEYEYISVYEIGLTIDEYGQPFERSFLIDDVLVDGETYYSYVKNTHGGGYVYGTFKLEYRSK